jgi:hypothetical protein
MLQAAEHHVLSAFALTFLGIKRACSSTHLLIATLSLTKMLNVSQTKEFCCCEFSAGSNALR